MNSGGNVQQPLMKSLFLLNTGQLEGEFGNAMGRDLTRGGASHAGVRRHAGWGQ